MSQWAGAAIRLLMRLIGKGSLVRLYLGGGAIRGGSAGPTPHLVTVPGAERPRAAWASRRQAQRHIDQLEEVSGAPPLPSLRLESTSVRCSPRPPAAARPFSVSFTAVRNACSSSDRDQVASAKLELALIF